MSDRSPVPNLPPITGIQDPATRSYLEALTQAWHVRNGQTRETDERFLTVKDLKEGVTQVVRGGGGGSMTFGSGSATGGVVGGLLGGLATAIKESKLNKLLEERIAKIEMPEWFRGKFGAEIQTEIVRQDSVLGSMAGEITTAVANVSNNVALAREELSVMADLASASAQQITTLQTEVAGVTTVAENALRLSQDITGEVAGSWTVKFDADGYITGAGLGLEGKNGNYSSAFVVRADRFAIGSPVDGQPAVFPFIVQTSGGQPIIEMAGNVWMRHMYSFDGMVADMGSGGLSCAQPGSFAVFSIATCAMYSATATTGTLTLNINGATTSKSVTIQAGQTVDCTVIGTQNVGMPGPGSIPISASISGTGVVGTPSVLSFSATSGG